MNNKLRYLALSLLVSVNLNANPDQSKIDEQVGQTIVDGICHIGASAAEAFDKKNEDALNDAQDDVEEKDGSMSETSTEVTGDADNGFMESIKAIPGAVKVVAQNGVAGVESFVANHPKSIAGVATAATVIAVYYGVKYYNASSKVATLEEQLEEANAIQA